MRPASVRVEWSKARYAADAARLEGKPLHVEVADDEYIGPGCQAGGEES
jgi:hypothetical protein